MNIQFQFSDCSEGNAQNVIGITEENTLMGKKESLRHYAKEKRHS